MVRAVESETAAREAEDRSDRDETITDPSGHRWRQVADDITPDAAWQLVQGGAGVAWDSCGSLGFAAPIEWLDKDDVAALAKTGPPEVRRGKRHLGFLAEWADESGERLVLVTHDVRWGKRLG